MHSSLVPRLVPSFLSHKVERTVRDKKLGRSLGTGLHALFITIGLVQLEMMECTGVSLPIELLSRYAIKKVV